MNPLVPDVLDILWTVLAVVSLTLTLIALVSVLRSRATLGPSASVIWALAVILIPILGATTWLIASRRLRQAEARRRTFVATAK